MKLWDRVAAALGRHFGRPVELLDRRAVGGGCINEASKISTSCGDVFVKTNAAPIDRLFSSEAAGLSALRAHATSLVVPEVIAFEDPEPGRPGFLVLELLPLGTRGRGFDEALGRGLAELHRATSAQGFGFSQDTYCGATLQPNRWRPTWLELYRDARLGHQLQLAVDHGHFSRADRALTERLLRRLEDRLAGSEEAPSLIHGDLWSGNLLVAADGRPALIDPAAYYGHREAELGMMTLFGGFGPRVWSAYEEARPLPAGWRERNPLYELYHVMNHANLFGGGYVGQSLDIIRRFS